MILKAGTAIRAWDENLMIALDADIYPTRTYPAVMHLGAEYSFKYLVLRGGINQVPSAGSMPSNNITLGAGLYLDNLRLDYAYQIYKEQSLTPAHFISVSYQPDFMPSRNVEDEEYKNEVPDAQAVPASVVSPVVEVQAAPAVVKNYKEVSWKIYKVLAGKQKNKYEADRLASYMSENGFDVLTRKVNKTNYIVQTGAFFDRSRAEFLLEELKKKGFSGEIVVE